MANAIYRLSVMFESITDYLTEMNRWWRKERIIIPLFGNFYNGPENSAFLASVIGLKDAEERKQNQTRLGLIELEIATQFINIAAGRNKKKSWETFNVKTNKTKLIAYKNRPHITRKFMLTSDMDTKTLHYDILVIHTQGETKTIKREYQRLPFQGKWRMKPTQDLPWTRYSPQYAYRELNGKLWTDCKIRKNKFNFTQKDHIISDKMDFQGDITDEELLYAVIHAEHKDDNNSCHNEPTKGKISKLSRKYKQMIKNNMKVEPKHHQSSNKHRNDNKNISILKNSSGKNPEEVCEGNIKLRLRRYSQEPNLKKYNNGINNK